MVGAFAWLALAALVLAALAAWTLGERARGFASIDRRLAGIDPGSATRRAPVAASRLRLAVPARMAPLLARAQVEPTVERLKLLAGGFAALLAIALVLAGPVAALALVIAAPAAGWAWLKRRAEKRIETLIEALPHFIDAIRQLQAVGNSLSQAIERALADAPAIVQSYFAAAARKLAMGAPVGETVQQLADRLQVPEVSMFAAAIRTNLRFGGSIGATFANLAAILRERLRVKRELAAATSEPRMSARVLTWMPLVAMVLLVAISGTSYVDFFLNDPRGHKLTLAAAGFEATGILVLRRMLRLAF